MFGVEFKFYQFLLLFIAIIKQRQVFSVTIWILFQLSMTNFTSVSLIDLKTQLEKLIESIDRKPFRNEIAEAVSDLKLIAYHLETYQTRIVDPITENANDVIVSFYIFLKRLFFFLLFTYN